MGVSVDSSKQQVNGKIRRVYSATPSGQKALQAAKHKVRELFGELFELEQKRP